MATDVTTLTDNELVATTEQNIWLSSFASNNPRAPAHARVNQLYTECTRRGKPHLYQRAWNQAYASAGYVPSTEDLRAAEDPSEMIA